MEQPPQIPVPPDVLRAARTRKIVIDEETSAVESPAPRPQASLIVLAGWEIGREVLLDTDTLTLGRAPEATVTIPAESVSRYHARIQRRPGEGKQDCHVIEDLGSTNGLRVNNTLVQSTPLQPGDKIQLGNVVLKFVHSDPMEWRFHQEVHRRIHFNELTGLMTFPSFQRRLEEELQRTGPDDRFAVVMTDLDGLKKVNDMNGHLAGTSVIRDMGTLIRQTLRPQDMAGLYGGDEAALLFPNTPLTQAQEIAERLRCAIEQHPFRYNERELHVTISQGLAEHPTHGNTVEQLIAAADGALYAAKAAGRNCVRLAGDHIASTGDTNN